MSHSGNDGANKGDEEEEEEEGDVALYGAFLLFLFSHGQFD